MLAEKVKPLSASEREAFFENELWRMFSVEQTLMIVDLKDALHFGVILAHRTMSSDQQEPIPACQYMMWQRWAELCYRAGKPRQDIAHVLRMTVTEEVFETMPASIQVASLCIMANRAEQVVQAVRIRESMLRRDAFRLGDYLPREDAEFDHDQWEPGHVIREREFYTYWWNQILGRTGEESHVGSNPELHGG